MASHPTHEPHPQKNKARKTPPPPRTKEPGRIPGYTYGSEEVAHSPITLKELDLLKQAILWSDEDTKYIRMSKDILKDQTGDILDIWYSFVGSLPFLASFFGKKDGKPDKEYLAKVRPRFEQWILDTAAGNYDQQWLDYQHEIALRHHRTKKNKTDHVQSTDIVNFRYLPAFIYPITATLKPFLAKKGHSGEDVECMYQAWLKSVTLQVCLWSYPYIKEGDF